MPSPAAPRPFRGALALAALLALAATACQPAVAPGGEVTAAGGAELPPDPSDPVSMPRPAPKTAKPAIPADFHGRYVSDAKGCGGTHHDDLAITIRADGIDFHESTGQPVAVAVDGDVLAVDLRMRGEGETWDSDVRFRREADGALLDLADGGPRRVRCPG